MNSTMDKFSQKIVKLDELPLSAYGGTGLTTETCEGTTLDPFGMGSVHDSSEDGDWYADDCT